MNANRWEIRQVEFTFFDNSKFLGIRGKPKHKIRSERIFQLVTSAEQQSLQSNEPRVQPYCELISDESINSWNDFSQRLFETPIRH